MIVIELVFGLMIAALVLLMLPIVLFMVGVAAAVTLWFVAPAAILGAMVFWLIFPDTSGVAILVFILVIGLLILDRRSRHRAY